MNSVIRQVLIYILLTLVFIDFSNAIFYNFNFPVWESKKYWVYLLAHLPFIFLLFKKLSFDLKTKNSLLSKVKNKLGQSYMPKAAKLAVALVFVGNFISISVGKPMYPFYDVGMFRWTTNVNNLPHTVYKPKYYFKDSNNQVKVLNLRKESVFFGSEYFGSTFTHEFTFSANFHNKNNPKTFEYLSEYLKRKHQIDTLWVGVHSVNYKTKEVKFNTNICNAIKINNEKSIHYGPIYIPEYQYEKCK